MPDGKFLLNVILKSLALFLAFDLIFAVCNPLPVLARFSIYNRLVPGRERFPFGENSREAVQPEPVQPGCDVCLP